MPSENLLNTEVPRLPPERGIVEPGGEEPPGEAPLEDEAEAPPDQRKVVQNDSFRSRESQETCSSHNETSASSPISSNARPDRILGGEDQQQQRDESPPPGSIDPSGTACVMNIRNLNREKARENLRPSIIQERHQEAIEQVRGLRRSKSCNSARPSIQRELSSAGTRGGRAIYRRQQSEISVRSFSSDGDEPWQGIGWAAPGKGNEGPIQSMDDEVSHVNRGTPQQTAAAATAARIVAQRRQQQQHLMRETSLRRVTPPDRPPPHQRQFDPPDEMPPTPSAFVAGGSGSFNYGRGENPMTPRKISARSFSSDLEIGEAPVGDEAFGIGSSTNGRIDMDEEASCVRRDPQAAAAAAAARIAAQRKDKLILMAQQLKQRQQDQQLIREEMPLRCVPEMDSTDSYLDSESGAVHNLISPPLRQPGPMHLPPQQRQFDPTIEMPQTSASISGGNNYSRGESPVTPQREIIMNNMIGGARSLSQRNVMMRRGPGSNISQSEGGPYNVSQRRLVMHGMGGSPRPSGPMMRSQSQRDPMVTSRGGSAYCPSGPMMTRSQSQRDPMINSVNSGGGDYYPCDPMMQSQSQRDCGPDPSVGPDIHSHYRSPSVGSLAGPPEHSHPHGTAGPPPHSAYQQYQPPGPVQHHHLPPAPPPSRSVEKTIEIAPDVWVRLRGADETWACIEHDYFMPATCFGCTLELCCIQDADYVLCPACRVVSPMNGLDDTDSNTMKNGGVGLGFTFEDLSRWQSEIVTARQQRQRHGVYAS